MKIMLLVAMALAASNTYAMEFIEDPASSGVLTVRDGEHNVLSYRYGDQLKPGVDPKYTRSCYIHPLYTLDGKPLTDDFPGDHFHHRGVCWVWPVVKTRGVTTQTWHPEKPPLRQHFVKWERKQVLEDGGVVFTSANKWVLDEKEEVAREMVTVTVHPKRGTSREIDFEIQIEAVGGPMTLAGTNEGKKGYGGFCLRAEPSFTGATLTTDDGTKEKDIVHRPQKWADLSTTTTGVAIFVPQDHPGFPPAFMARNSYAGFMNVSWPGLKEVVVKEGDPVILRYRLYVHEGRKDLPNVKKAYSQYAAQP